jgi:hypothetical protein
MLLSCFSRRDRTCSHFEILIPESSPYFDIENIDDQVRNDLQTREKEHHALE